MEPYLAEIRMFGGNFAPRSWALCQGQLLAISQNQALFSLLGTQYGGDGRTTFALPDLRSRVPVSPGQGPGLSNYSQGQMGGSATNTLITTQLASHNHTATGSGTLNLGPGAASAATGTNNSLASSAASNLYIAGDPNTGIALKGNTVETTANIPNAGGQQPLNNVQPILVVNYIICISGLFPSRN